MKQKQGKLNWLVILVIGIGIAFAMFYFVLDTEEKQVPHPADLVSEDEGTLTVRLKDEDGNEGEMLKDFYKVTGIVGSVIRGTTSVSCSTDFDCTNRCDGNTFCLDHIFCYTDRCTYGPGASGTPITQMALSAQGKNDGSSILDVTFDTATTNPSSTTFGTSHASNLGVTREVQPGATTTFSGGFFSLSGYETGSQTTFTVGLHAVDTFDETRYPASGSLTADVMLVVSPDPVGGFSVAISQLPGI